VVVLDNPLFGFDPAWSVAGTMFAAGAWYGANNGGDEVIVMYIDGTGLVNLTNSPQNEYDPIWAPAGI
jgi:hypothetical protein